MLEIIEWPFFMLILLSTVSTVIRNFVTVISIFSYISVFLFCQMGSGPRGVWCLPAGVLESMEALAPPSGWRCELNFFLDLDVQQQENSSLFFPPLNIFLFVFRATCPLLTEASSPTSAWMEWSWVSTVHNLSFSQVTAVFQWLSVDWIYLLTRSWELHGLGESAALQPPGEHHEGGNDTNNNNTVNADPVLLKTSRVFIDLSRPHRCRVLLVLGRCTTWWERVTGRLMRKYIKSLCCQVLSRKLKLNIVNVLIPLMNGKAQSSSTSRFEH